MPTENRVLIEHEEIRKWVEERGASPARVRDTGGDGDIGMLRIDFPGYTGAESLEPISWDEFFQKFDERGLALLVQDVTASGERSNFNKIVSREIAEAAEEKAAPRVRGRVRAVSAGAEAEAARAPRRAKPAPTKTAGRSKTTAKKATARAKTKTAKTKTKTKTTKAAARTVASKTSHKVTARAVGSRKAAAKKAPQSARTTISRSRKSGRGAQGGGRKAA